MMVGVRTKREDMIQTTNSVATPVNCFAATAALKVVLSKYFLYFFAFLNIVLVVSSFHVRLDGCNQRDRLGSNGDGKKFNGDTLIVIAIRGRILLEVLYFHIYLHRYFKQKTILFHNLF